MPHRRYVIWDLDNCLANDFWRIPLIDWDADHPYNRYHEYHQACDGDALVNAFVFAEFHGPDKAALPLFITGRPESVRLKTCRWIGEHLGVANPMILMRPETYHGASVDLKRQLLNSFPHKHLVTHAFDDREDVIKMYRRDFGITAAAVLAIYTTASAYTKGNPHASSSHL